jgi:hypothetical protein
MASDMTAGTCSNDPGSVKAFAGVLETDTLMWTWLKFICNSSYVQ